jgi:hypothetical protein
MPKCNKCGLEKEVSELVKDNRRPLGYVTRCKSCSSKYLKEFYLRKRENFVEILDPETKRVCPYCQVEKQINEFVRDKSLKHGYANQCKDCRREYNTNNYFAKKAGAPPATEGERKCKLCGEIKTMAEFTTMAANKGGRSYTCYTCYAVKHTKYLKDNPAIAIKCAETSQRNYELRKEEFYMWVMQQKCVDCGEDDFRCLEFDHLDNKSFGIAQRVGKVTTKRLMEEVAKCEVRCSNCHKIKTALAGDYYKYIGCYDKATYKIKEKIV